MQSGGNMEGKEVRYGLANSALWATVTTDTSCGAVNSMHDSYTPLGGMVPLSNIMLSENNLWRCRLGDVRHLIYVVLAVFIAGLMVGRTPEYLGKKIESYDVKMAMLVTLVFPLVVLIFAAISVVSPNFGTSQVANPGHTVCLRFYMRSRKAQAITDQPSPVFRRTHSGTTRQSGSRCWLGASLMIIPMLAVAGNLAKKKSCRHR